MNGTSVTYKPAQKLQVEKILSEICLELHSLVLDAYLHGIYQMLAVLIYLNLPLHFYDLAILSLSRGRPLRNV